MYYELFQLNSGNRIGESEDAQERLLGDVWYIVRLRGPSAIAGIGFRQLDDEGRRKVLAKGRDLLELAVGADSVAVY